jgi:hypothetical protein
MLRIITDLLIFFGLLSACAGYVMNIAKLFSDHEGFATAAARVLGVIFFPIGCILGWF